MARPAFMTAIVTSLGAGSQWHGLRMASPHPLLRLLATEETYVVNEPDLSSAYDALVMERWAPANASALPHWALAAFYRVRRVIPRWLQLAL